MNDEILEIFDQMAAAYRGRLKMKPNARAERFIDQMMAKLCGALSTQNRRLKEQTAIHLQKSEIKSKQGGVVGWRTCDCHACTVVGRSPAGPDFRYTEEKDGDV